MVSLTTLRFTPGMLARIFADTLLIQVALIAALAVRVYFSLQFGDRELSILVRDYTGFYLRNSIPLTLICIVVFCFAGFYSRGRYYRGRYKALVITQAVALSYILFGFLSAYFTRTIPFPRAALFLAFLFTTVLLLSARLWNWLWKSVVLGEELEVKPVRVVDNDRVLVIGGAGYIGSALLPKLLEQNYKVRLLDILLYGESPIREVMRHPNLEVIQGDFRHVENVVEAMQGVNSVIHLGAIVGDPACNLNEDLTIDINLSATRMIAELARAMGASRFLFASTCSVYGACDDLLDERSQATPVSLYGRTKLASERVLLDMASDSFFPTVLRIATIYGLSGRLRFDLVVNLLTAKAKIDGEITIFGGEQWRPFVHVDDAALFVALVLGAPPAVVSQEIFNVGSNQQNFRIAQVGEFIQQQVIGSKLILTSLKDDPRNYRVDFSKARDLLGFQPKWTLEEGICQVMEAIDRGDVGDYRQPEYNNVEFLSREGSKRLNQNWARTLIEELSS